MRALRFVRPGEIEVTDREEPRLESPSDAIVRTSATCVCGSDLWPFRGINDRDEGSVIGHECIGEVVDVGHEVSSIRVGDFVVVPFLSSCGHCRLCALGEFQSCEVAVAQGVFSVQGAQAEYVRAPLADGSLVVVPGGRPSEDLLPDLLALADVMGTGYHAAIAARVGNGSTVAVVGDGAVGLCAVLSARLLGAERIIALSRHEDRQSLALEFGATDIVTERGDDAVAVVRELTAGLGVDAVLECVGTAQAMSTAFGLARPGAIVGYVGLPHDAIAPFGRMFRHNIGIDGGVAPTRRYSNELVDRVMRGEIRPGRVFDLELPFERLPEGYQAMDERRSIKAWSRLA